MIRTSVKAGTVGLMSFSPGGKELCHTALGIASCAVDFALSVGNDMESVPPE